MKKRDRFSRRKGSKKSKRRSFHVVDPAFISSKETQRLAKHVEQLEEVFEGLERDEELFLRVMRKKIIEKRSERGIEAGPGELSAKLVEKTLQLFQEELYFARIELDAQQLADTIRKDLRFLNKQNPPPAYRVIKIPTRLGGEDPPGLSVEELEMIPMIYCRRIWDMMSLDWPERYPTHIYLEGKEEWFSAEIFMTEKEAIQEAAERKMQGEGEFEIRQDEDERSGVTIFLYSKQKPGIID